MIIIALEGVHSTGKSSCITELGKKGYKILPEKFMNQEIPFLSKFSTYAQTLNLTTWIKDVLEFKKNGCKVLFTDRSPYTTLIYGSELMYNELVKKLLTELKEVGIIMVTVHITCEKEEHWNRLVARLISEPERSDYNEQSREWFEHISDMYYKYAWDHTVNNDILQNTVKTIEDLASGIQQINFD